MLGIWNTKCLKHAFNHGDSEHSIGSDIIDHSMIRKSVVGGNDH